MIDRLRFRETEGCLFEQLIVIFSVTLQETDLFNSHKNLQLIQTRKGRLYTLHYQLETFFFSLEHTFLYLRFFKGEAVRPKEKLLGWRQRPWGYSWSRMAKPEHNSSACIPYTPVWLSEAGEPISQPSVLI